MSLYPEIPALNIAKMRHSWENGGIHTDLILISVNKNVPGSITLSINGKLVFELAVSIIWKCPLHTCKVGIDEREWCSPLDKMIVISLTDKVKIKNPLGIEVTLFYVKHVPLSKVIPSTGAIQEVQFT